MIYAPRSKTRILRRRVSRRPHAPVAVGDVVCVGRARLHATAVAQRVETRADGMTERIIDVFTASANAVSPLPRNVVPMPVGDDTVVAQFIRYHVLIRVFHGDPDAWLAQLLARGEAADGGDLRFVRWIRSRLRHDPALLASIRRMVDATPFWRVAEA
ncbi:MAG TPA: hypothetical protein VE010_11855 [Thermoanaerobaculia bacterium]|nr:hypothetical protein [Thermoanaerobaculia bacterium]